jgi:hypothetical protein
VAYFLHAGTVAPQKPQHTQATIEVRVFSARCCVTHATMGSLLSAPRPLIRNDSVNVSTIEVEFSVWLGTAI